MIKRGRSRGRLPPAETNRADSSSVEGNAGRDRIDGGIEADADAGTDASTATDASNRSTDSASVAAGSETDVNSQRESNLPTPNRDRQSGCHCATAVTGLYRPLPAFTGWQPILTQTLDASSSVFCVGT